MQAIDLTTMASNPRSRLTHIQHYFIRLLQARVEKVYNCIIILCYQSEHSVLRYLTKRLSAK